MTDVIMPQMGESIAEGTLTKWLKNLGDKVERDEPLFEISTDKVDAEIPAAASGILAEIRVQPGTTVPINTVVGVIASGEAAVASPPPAGSLPAVAPAAPAPSASAVPPPLSVQAVAPAAPAPSASAVLPPVAAPPAAPPVPTAPPIPEKPRSEMTVDELRRTRSSPVVRKIAAEHDVDLQQIPGTGISGRVTKQDIQSHLESRTAASGAPAPPPAAAAPPAAVAPPAAPSIPVERPLAPAVPPTPAAAPAAPAAAVPPAPVLSPAPPVPASRVVPAPVAPSVVAGSERVQIVPMSPIRKRTAEHMVLSKRTSAHVSTVFEVDMTRVDHLRRQYKHQYEERSGIKLTYMPFILKATIDALKAFPILNSSVDGESIVYHHDINIGMAVALEWGLIVPVIRSADEKNILGLARAVNDLAERARGKRLKVDEVQGGTFTITNPGVFGSLFGTPIISQPQVAILGVGTIEKRPVVRDDAIAIRTMAYLALTFDHRIVDGSDADRFMAHLKKGLQEFDESAL